MEVVALRRADWLVLESSEMRNLTAEFVEGASLPLESIDNVQGPGSWQAEVLSLPPFFSLLTLTQHIPRHQLKLQQERLAELRTTSPPSKIRYNSCIL